MSDAAGEDGRVVAGWHAATDQSRRGHRHCRAVPWLRIDHFPARPCPRDDVAAQWASGRGRDGHSTALLIVPIDTRTLRGVTSVSRTTRYPKPGAREQQKASPVRPEAEGVLFVEREGESLAISTSPAQLEDVERRVRDFLEGGGASLQLRLVSNWKFGVLAMALVALPGVLLLLATSWHIVTTGLKSRRACLF
jgi:hypothetical protein